ncbi:MAG: right-handed parallel beta-helix repeat-containing protein [Chloroflexi bacterium]|nr:right-handed parallel beta-helix repeat-containing protein [Chloroflexota bacterium]
MAHHRGMSRVIASAQQWRHTRWVLRAALSLAVMGASVGPWPGSRVAQAAFLDVADACDRVVEADEAPPGTVVRLIGPVAHACTPEFDAFGALIAGNGITIAAPGVTLDLNGHSIHSTSDAAADPQAVGEVENIGVIVAAANVTVTNSSTAVSLVDDFTANAEIEGSGALVRGLRVDHDSNPGTSPVYNLVFGNSHGAAMAIVGSGAMVDTVLLHDLSIEGVGLEIVRTSNVTVQQSRIVGSVTGLFIRESTSVSVVNNEYISGPTGILEDGIMVHGDGMEIIRNSSAITISGNTIADSRDNGIILDRNVGNVTIQDNFILNNGGCGINAGGLTVGIVSRAPRVFANNAGGDTCGNVTVVPFTLQVSGAAIVHMEGSLVGTPVAGNFHYAFAAAATNGSVTSSSMSLNLLPLADLVITQIDRLYLETDGATMSGTGFLHPTSEPLSSVRTIRFNAHFQGNHPGGVGDTFAIGFYDAVTGEKYGEIGGALSAGANTILP